jgi:hypothetical protein
MHSEGCSYFNPLPFLLFARCQDRDKDGRDKGCGEELRGTPLWHIGENKYHHSLCPSSAAPLTGI